MQKGSIQAIAATPMSIPTSPLPLRVWMDALGLKRVAAEAFVDTVARYSIWSASNHVRRKHACCDCVLGFLWSIDAQKLRLI